jgi:hypothetical protein
MSSATTAAPGFSNDDLVQLLDLLKGADSVELKLTVPEPHQRSTVEALELDPLEAQIRQVFFFDTPELDLDAHGVVVRARRIQGKGGDSIVKLRPVVPSELPEELRLSGSVSRWTRFPAGSSAPEPSRARLTRPTWLARQGDPLPKLFSKEQRYVRAHAPQDGLDDLTVPADSSRCASSRRAQVVAEMWLYPTAPASSSCDTRRDERGVPGRRRDRAFLAGTASISRASRKRRPARRSVLRTRASKEKS